MGMITNFQKLFYYISTKNKDLNLMFKIHVKRSVCCLRRDVTVCQPVPIINRCSIVSEQSDLYTQVT